MINRPQQSTSLRRYAIAVERLRTDLRRNINNNMHDGIGDIAVRLYRGIHAGLSATVDDPFLTALALGDLAVPSRDKEKVALVNLLSGQLKIYIESAIEDAQQTQATIAQTGGNHGG